MHQLGGQRRKELASQANVGHILVIEVRCHVDELRKSHDKCTNALDDGINAARNRKGCREWGWQF